MSHKRKSSHGESPPAKRPNQAALESTDPPEAANQFVYLAVEEEYGRGMETQQNVFEIYATVEDANNRLLARQREETAIDDDEWQTSYDEHGCLHSVAEDAGADGIELKVRRMEVKPPGSAPAVPVRLSRSSEENSYDEEGDEYEEEEEELHPQKPARTWTKKDSPFSDCGGCGCGGCGCGGCENCLSMWDHDT